MLNFKVSSSGPLQGHISVPGDKSISHRSIMLGSLAEGITRIEGFLEGEDSLATLKAFQAMGVKIERPEKAKVTVHGVGMHGLKPAEHALDLGNSGTSMRLLVGLLAAQRFDSELIGDQSLMSRPMNRVVEPLTTMGAVIAHSNTGTAPLKIKGGQRLIGIDYLMPVVSAQVKSSLLLAGMYAQDTTCITERETTRDHTERMLSGLGYSLKHSDLRVCIKGGGRLYAVKLPIPADLSSAAFFIIGAAITPDSHVVLKNVGVNPTRTGVIHILRQMGADIRFIRESEFAGELVADIEIRYQPLRGINISPGHVSLAIDEFPIIFIAAACARGKTVLEHAAELKVKESDRLGAMADGLKKLGIDANTTESGMEIEGGKILGGRVNSFGDHRIAMAFAMAGLRSEEEILIEDCENVNTSFPNFVETATVAGLQIVMQG